jgi:hypothetical protein
MLQFGWKDVVSEIYEGSEKLSLYTVAFNKNWAELNLDTLITIYPSKLFCHQNHHALVIWTEQFNE